MRYLLLISADEERAAESMAAGAFDDVGRWLDDLRTRGVLEVHEGVRGDEVLLTDGPFAEGREQVGGLVIVDCRDLDEAIEIAAGHPATAIGQVEIRPLR